jgi:S-adenosylmethionine:tRNA ribosyltransferase-isomerase
MYFYQKILVSMIDFTNTSIAEYSYNLPDKKIAKYPLEQRDSSKLLVYKNSTIIDSSFSKSSTIPK